MRKYISLNPADQKWNSHTRDIWWNHFWRSSLRSPTTREIAWYSSKYVYIYIYIYIYISPMEHTTDGDRVYIGISVDNWKQSLYNHRHSFSNLLLRNQTALSKYFWSLKKRRLTTHIKGKINSFWRSIASMADATVIVYIYIYIYIHRYHNLVWSCERNSYNVPWAAIIPAEPNPF